MGVRAGFGGRLLPWAVGVAVLGAPHPSSQVLPVTALPMTLVGVMADTGAPSRSTCLIRCKYPVEAVGTFAAGQRACDVAEIREIGRDLVVLHNPVTNRLERLTFRDATPEVGTASDADARPARNEPAVATAAPPPPVVRRSQNTVTVDLAEGAVRHHLEHLPALLDSALAMPRYREGENGPRTIEGFEIGRIRSGSLVEQMGIQNGDVIVAVNGQPLDSLASVIALVGQAQTLPQAKLTVLRSGRTLTFVINRK